MPIVTRVHHTSLPVRDLDASIAFYEGVLGLERLPRPDMGVPGVWLGVGDAQVHLIHDPARVAVSVEGDPDPRGRHEAFAVDDLDVTRAYLVERGIPVVGGSRGARQMWVKDPDGHVLEFIQPA